MGHEHHESHAKSKLTFLASPLVSEKHATASEVSSLPSKHHDSPIHDPESLHPHQIDDVKIQSMPEFQRHEESTTIELFYDLFFVANLTTFTSIHEINESHALSSYAGFFCILWFTWCQVGLFDVRFITDSVVERIAKACQFGVMVGFSVVGPNFDPAAQKQDTFRALSLILAISRFVLFVQYLTVMWQVKKFKNTNVPLSIIAATNFVAGIIYVGIAFTFKKKGNTNTYLAWYVISVAEICINIIVSSKWKVVSFKGTHLVQRMSLLTLIILGEGIIVICKSISQLVKNEYAWSPATIGVITAAYLLYMLYFDWLSHKHFGNIRQQIWAFLHFPFHLSLVLFMEGTAQFVIWQKLGEVLDRLRVFFMSASMAVGLEGDSPANMVKELNQTVINFTTLFPPKYGWTYDDLDNTLIGIAASETNREYSDLVEHLSYVVQNSLYTTYGIAAPKNKSGQRDVVTELDQKYNVFILVVGLTSISHHHCSPPPPSFGLILTTTLLLLNLLNYLSISHVSSGKLSKTQKVRLALTTFVGIFLSCLAIAMTAGSQGWRFVLYAQGPWILPTVVLGFGLVFLCTQIGRVGDKKTVEDKE